MMAEANVPLRYRFRLFPLAFDMAMQLDSLIIVDVDGTKATRYEHFHGVGNLPRWAKHLRAFGLEGIVTIKSN